jgi:dual specificity MAP kinase phosphatase/atypical dual specificity phosphatase
VIAYLIKKKKMTYPEAIQFVKERRKAINPNSGFRNQLEAYDKNSI